jgi:hypothetical protein
VQHTVGREIVDETGVALEQRAVFYTCLAPSDLAREIAGG